MAILRVRKGAHPGAVYPVFASRKPAVIGRDSEVEVTLDDPKSSRRNSRLARVYGHWCVEDLQSSNGTFVNAKRVDKAILEDGAALQIGRTLLGFHAGELAQFPDLELAGVRPQETLRESSGVFVFRGLQVALDRPVRLDWVHTARASGAGIGDQASRAFTEAAQLTDLGILPLIHSQADPQGIFVIFKGSPLPSLADEWPRIIEMPMEDRLQIFRQLVQAVLQRSTWEHLRSPIGLTHVSLELKARETPNVLLPPVELAALVAETQGDLTHSPEHVPYLPPEYQHKQRPAQPPFSATMYNLGAIGYHLLTGQAPAGEGALKTILASHRDLQPAPAEMVSRDIPAELSRLLMRMLEKDPARRPTGRQEVIQAIPFSAGEPAPPPASDPARTEPPPSAPPAPSRSSSPESAAPERRMPVRPSRRVSPSLARQAATLPLWAAFWFVLFFAVRYLSRMLFQTLES